MSVTTENIALHDEAKRLADLIEGKRNAMEKAKRDILEAERLLEEKPLEIEALIPAVEHILDVLADNGLDEGCLYYIREQVHGIKRCKSCKRLMEENT